MDRQKEGWTDRQVDKTDGWTDRNKGWADRQNRWVNRLTNGWVARLVDKWANIQQENQTGRQTDRWLGRQTALLVKQYRSKSVCSRGSLPRPHEHTGLQFYSDKITTHQQHAPVCFF